MTQEPESIIKKFEWLSERYHKLSLLFYELSKSLAIQSKSKDNRKFREYLKSLNLDINKIRALSRGLSDLTLNDLKKDKKV